MATHADFTPDEWNVLVNAPAQAAMLIINADKSGGISGHFGIVQETKDARKAVEAHTQDPALVGEAAQALVEQTSWKPLVQGSDSESVTTTLSRADEIVTRKAGPEADSYRRYVMDVARKTASATKESSGLQTSEKEQVALRQIQDLLHTDA